MQKSLDNKNKKINYVIYGAGRMGQSFSISEHSNEYTMCAYCDASKDKQGSSIKGYPVISKEELKDFCDSYSVEMIIIGIGDHNVKEKITEELQGLLGKDIAFKDFNDMFFSYTNEWVLVKELLSSRVIPNTIGAAFCESCFAYFVDAGTPLVDKYVEKGQNCIAIFPRLDDAEWSFAGIENLKRLYTTIQSYIENGVTCVSQCNKALNNCHIGTCFNLGYEMTYIPYDMDFGTERKNIVIQSTPMMTHLYIKGVKKEDESVDTVFDDDMRSNIDFYIGSDYSCDYIVKNSSGWENKVVRLGYPRMDKIFQVMNSEMQVPNEWQDRLNGKTVFFSALYNVEPYLELFPKDNGRRVLLWRPHPLELRNTEYVERIKKFEEEYEVIIDLLPNYYVASSVSDALISNVEVSLNLNYLYYQKPILLILKDSQIGDYEDQAWYMAMYKASSREDIEKFLCMVEKGEYLDKESLDSYRKYMTMGFDGHVCDRIYEFVRCRVAR